MNLSEKRSQQDNRIMKLLSNLGVEYITHPVLKTNKGALELMLRKGESATDYRFVFDSVPMDDEKNDELKELFKIV